MATTRPKSRFWRICRIYFRRFRIAVWLVVLILIGTFVYLNQIGLPGFIKKPVLENLRAHGLDVRFSRLRLRWYRGLVAEDVRFERADEPFGPQFTVQEIQVRLNHDALAHLRFQVDSLLLNQGRLVWPIPETNAAPRQLAVEHIQTELRFLPDDEWSLDHFTATFAGARIKLSGTITNASMVREWRFFQAAQPTPAGLWQERLRQLADTLERIRFPTSPELALDVRGDARDLQSFTVRMQASAPGAETPWGTLTRGRCTVGIYPPDTNGMARADLNLEADEAQTRWGTTANVQLTAQLASAQGQFHLANGNLSLCASRVTTEWASATNLQATLHAAEAAGDTNLLNATLQVHAGQVTTRWGSTSNLLFSGEWAHALTNAIPLAGAGQLVCEGVDTHWGAADELRLRARLATPSSRSGPSADASWAGWGWLEPYILDWGAEVRTLRTSQLAAQELTGGGSWRAPDLILTNLVARLDQRQLVAHSSLNVATRKLRLGFSSNLDPHTLGPRLIPGSERILAPFSWEQPPQLNGEISLVLPPWTNRPPDWRAEMKRSMVVQGEFNLERGGAYRNVPISSARSHVLYSNQVWHLPDLIIARPEGRVQASAELEEPTQCYSVGIRSSIDVLALLPALDADARSVLELFTFSQPPVLEAEIRGCVGDLNSLGARGHASLTNFSFRGEAISSLQTAAQYTNRFALFTAPRLQCGDRLATADGVGADFVGQRVYLTNGFSTVPPMLIANIIGEHVVRAIQDYRFEEPPEAHVHGIIPMRGEEDADLHFDLKGGPFNWWRLHVPEVSGHVHWRGEHLTLSNIHAQLYGGQAAGAAGFDFYPGKPTDYHFAVTTTNTEAQDLILALFMATNRMRGALSGTLIVTNADTSSLQTWNGFGNLQLRDGLIWEIPVFGIFSDVLNGMVPGLGSSRATAGTCTFGITNGVIRSNDVDIRSTGVRLQYRGTVDFDGRVKARVEAGLMHDIWLVGPVVSTVFWPVTKVFEYKVSGTLNEPKVEPVFLIPKVMLLPFQMPFHPFRTLKGLLPEDWGASRTNNPALTPPKVN
jgi:hypothetical protein